MTKEIMNTIYTTLSAVNFENKPAVMEALEKELHRNDAAKAAKDALYDEAREVVLEVLRGTKQPLTVAEIFAECEKNLPKDFTKGQVTQGLTKRWTDAVEKIEGKTNSYRIK